MPNGSSVQIALTNRELSTCFHCQSKDGHSVQLFRYKNRWLSKVVDNRGLNIRSAICPVLCSSKNELDKELQLLKKLSWKQQCRRIHVFNFDADMNQRPCVFIGELGLKGGSPQISTRGLQRTTSNALLSRLTHDDITSTEGLVEALNASRDAFRNAPLTEWVQQYINWFAKQPLEALTTKIIKEYLLLANIQARGITNKELLHEWFCSLCNRILQGLLGEKKLVEALNVALQLVDVQIFEQDPSLLIKVAKALLEKLDPDTTVFTRQSYPTHSPVLGALHQSFLLIRQIAPKQIDRNEDSGLYHRCRTRLQKITDISCYYPFEYQAQLIGISLQKTTSNDAHTRWISRRRRIVSGVKGALHLLRGVRALAAFDIDIEAIEAGYENIVDAFANRSVYDWPWYSWIQALEYSAQLARVDDGKEQIFLDCYATVLTRESALKRIQDRKALRYGVICQLEMLSIDGGTYLLRERCQQELIRICTDSKTKRGWFDDGDIFEALLDAMRNIVVRQHGNEAIREMLCEMTVEPLQHLTAAVHRWLDGLSIKDKLDSMVAEQDMSEETGALFCIIRRELLDSLHGNRSRDFHEFAELRTLLEKNYRRSQFTKMDALFEGDRPKHVKSIECQLMLLERNPAKEEEEAEDDTAVTLDVDDDADHLSSHHDRLEQTKTPISKEELFKRRCLESDGYRDIRRVLLTGDPGAGKTTLARHLTYMWAMHLWGEEFDIVFFLQVRDLKASKYDDANERREETLSTAIANDCFPRCNKNSYLRLRDQIEEALELTSTLLILDGLDESNGASEAILDQAKDSACKLLLLGRPYGVQEERLLADIEVEQAGFNDCQLMNCIQTELSSVAAKELSAFLKATPVIWKTAHCPVNAQILCTVWRDPRLRASKASSSASLSMLYRRMTHYTWERFVLKANYEDTNVMEVFDALGLIAFQAMKHGQILIEDWLVQDNARTLQMKRMLKESGFLLLHSVGNYYEFPHLTFQEYFAGRWLARHFCSGTEEEKTVVKEFVSDQKYSREYRVVLSFMMGEVTLVGGDADAQKLLDVINDSPREIVGVQHVILELRMIDDHLSASNNCRRPLTLRTDALSQLQRLLSQCSNDGLLLSVLTAALAEVPNAVQCFPVVMDSLLELCKSKRRCRQALKSVLDILSLAQNYASRVRESVTEIFTRSGPLIREEIVMFIRQSIQARPEHGSVFSSLILSALRDENARIRGVAQYGVPLLKNLIEPLAMEELLAAVIEGCRDDLYSVRRAALGSCQHLICLQPHYTTKLLKTITSCSWDTYDVVRKAATAILQHLLQESTRHLDAIVEIMTTASYAEDSEIRCYNISAVCAIMKVLPEPHAALDEIVTRGCQDNSREVRSAAIESMGAIAAEFHLPSKNEILEAFNDEHYTVRKAAIKAAEQTIFGATEEQKEQIAVALLKAMTDDDFLIRVSAIKAIAALLQYRSDINQELSEAIITSLQDEVYTVRSAAVEVIGEIAIRFPDHRAELLGHVKNACFDSYSHVRASARELLLRMAGDSPEDMDYIVAALKEQSYDDSSTVKQGMIEIVAELMKTIPDQSSELLKTVSFGLTDSDHQVQRAMMDLLGEVHPLHMQQLPELPEKLLDICLDGAASVRTAARQRLESLLLENSETASNLLERIQHSATNPKNRVRETGFQLLRAAVKRIPAKIPSLLPLVREGCSDDKSYVKQAALLVAQTIIQLGSMHRETTTELLFTATKHLHGRVRSTAYLCMGTTFDCSPELFKRFIPSLVAAFDDLSYTVRRSTFQVVKRCLALQPKLLSYFISPIIKTLHRSAVLERLGTESMLEKIPLEHLIKCFWKTELKMEVAAVLIPRLYTVSLTVQSDQSGIILHSAPAIQHNVSKQELFSFTESIHNALEQKHAIKT